MFKHRPLTASGKAIAKSFGQDGSLAYDRFVFYS